MKLSSQKDLLLIIILSLIVIILNGLGLFKGYLLTFTTIILILFLPGYAIITTIWPTDEKMGWGMRSCLGFVLGLFFLLFLPLILNSVNQVFISENLNNLLFILAIVLSILAMARRSAIELEETPKEKETQLTLEEAIERAARMRQQPTEEHEAEYYKEHHEHDRDTEDHKETYSEYKEETESEDEIYPEHDDEETYPDQDAEEEIYPDHEETHPEHDDEDEYIYPEKDEDTSKTSPDEDELEDSDYESWREKIKKQKPLQYQRIKEKNEEEPQKHYPLRVDESVKTESSPSDYEQEMDTPVWREEPPEKKPGFKYWDLFFILFLSGISLLFLYFNPLKTPSTSIIFFVLLIFILGYAAITIIFPDKSKTSLRNLLIASGIIAIVLFVVSFLACSMQLLPSLPEYCVKILFIASLVLVVGAFLRKWRTPQEEADDLIEDEEISEDEDANFEEEELIEESKEKLIEETPKVGGKNPLRFLKNLGEPVIIDENKTTEEPKRKDDSQSPFLGGSKWEKALSIILVICIILAIATTVYMIIKPKEGEKFTEFYILGPNGTASNYPTNLTTGQNGSVIIGIVNHEYANTDYQMVVKIDNITSYTQNITLANGEKLEIPYNFTAGASGQKKMEFILYKQPDTETVYRSLHLWQNIG